MVEDEYGGSGMLGYEVVITEGADRRYGFTCQSLPELVGDAPSREAALRAATAMLDQIIAARMNRGEEIPPFDRLPAEPGATRSYATLRAIHVLKLQLYIALRRQGMTRADMMRALGWHRNQVDRLFDLGHMSRLDQLEDAGRIVGLSMDPRLVVNVEGRFVQVTGDGDGWRVRLAVTDPGFAGDVLTPAAVATKAEAQRIADAVRRALNCLGASSAPSGA